jgi:hypothetical protein
MTGSAGEILRQASALAAAKKMNLTFRLDSKKLYVTLDPEDLPDHPQRRGSIRPLPGRALGFDLNPTGSGWRSPLIAPTPRKSKTPNCWNTHW